MRQLSVPAMHHVQHGDNLTTMLVTNAQSNPNRVSFLRRDQQGALQPVTAQQFLEQVSAVAQGLIAAGIQPGQRVGLMSKTRYEWALLDFAIWCSGAVSVPIYETSSAEQVSWILRDSAAVACVVETAEHRRTLDAVRAELPHLHHVWQIEGNGVDLLINSGKGVHPDQVRTRREQLNADSLATIIYTSGTTGRPKGCELTHRNLLAVTGNAVAYVREVFQPKNATTVMFLPLAHVLARAVQLMCVMGDITIAHSSDVKDLSKDLTQVKPTFILAVPRVFEKLYDKVVEQAGTGAKGKLFSAAAHTATAYSQALDHGKPGVGLRAKHRLFDLLVYRKLRKAMGGRLSIAVSGGAAISAPLCHFFRGVGLTIIEGYGLTETSSATNVNVPRTNRIGTVGRPLPGLSVRVDGDGQIRVKGDTVFRGYHNNPQASAGEFDEDGYFLTGDLGRLDDQGYLHITGRAKEILVTAGGKNVIPGPLEDVVRSHPLVAQVLVVGDNRPYIAALVTLDPEALPAWLQRSGLDPATTVEQLTDNPNVLAEIQQAVDRANSSVSQAEGIKRFEVLPDQWTENGGQLTPSLKLKRSVVAKQCAQQIDALYTRGRA